MAAYTLNGLTIVDMTLTKSWGMTPASASIHAVGTSSFTAGTDVAINLGASVFDGVITRIEQTEQDGRFWEIEVSDNRIKLDWDTVYGCFNMIEVIEDDPSTPGIDRKKRYWHIYPDDWHAQGKTYTEEPLSARDICQLILDADTVHYGWTLGSHSKLSEPIFAIDANTGKKVSNCLQEVCQKLGLQLTLSGSYTIAFSEKGEGEIPIPGTNNTKDRVDGEALGPETKVRIVGDRNIYQDMPLTLEPDWVPHFETYWFQPKWVSHVMAVLGISDRTQGEARAREVTLREYCAATSSANADYGKWGEVSRMEIPVWIYITDIVWKSYRIPRSYKINNIGLDSIELREELVAAVQMDTSGSMQYKNPPEYYPETKAAVMVQGMPLSLLDPTTEDAFKLSSLSSLSSAWQPNNRFRLDTKNKTVIFEEPVFRVGASALFVQMNSGIEQSPQNIVVPNADFTPSAANVKASFAFEAERFSMWYGSGNRQASSYVSGINYHVLMSGGSWVREVTYSDDKSAVDKADKAANAFLTNQPYIQSGGYTRIGQGGMVLNGTISRITTRVSFTEGGESDGIQEVIEYAKERIPGIFDSDTELARRQQTRDLFPGQSDLKEAARQLRLISKLTKDAKRQVQRPYENMDDVTRKLPGNIHCSPTYVYPGDVSEFPVGRPIYVNSELKVRTDGTRFMGVCSCAGQNGGSKVIVVTQGVVPVRVKCKVKDGETIEINPGDELQADPQNDYAEAIDKSQDNTSGATSDTSLSTRTIGVAEDKYNGTEIAVIRMRITGGGVQVKATRLAGYQEWSEALPEPLPGEEEQDPPVRSYLFAGRRKSKASQTSGSQSGGG